MSESESNSANKEEVSVLIREDSSPSSFRIVRGVGGHARNAIVLLVTISVSLLVVVVVLLSSRQHVTVASDAFTEDVACQEVTAVGDSDKKKSKKQKKESSSTTSSVASTDTTTLDAKTLATCLDGKYPKRTLKLLYELPFMSLFQDAKGQTKHEASSVIVVDHQAYAICDSSWALSRFSPWLQPFGNNNVHLGDPDRIPEEESDYEALFHDQGTFYAVRESVLHEDDTYHAIIEELTVADQGSSSEGLETLDYVLGDSCSCEFEFEGDSKGFEGAIAVRDLDNELVILGLCEGNHCSESKKDDKGNGKFIAMKKKTWQTSSGESPCMWETIRKIKIPESANFLDYSAASLRSDGKIAITSQENSQLWIGQMLGQQENGLWDIDAIQLEEEGSVVYDFPKNDQCMTVYCNIEGIHWLNDQILIAVSDKMKSKGKQDFRCFEKDQSVHIFALPA